VTLLGGKKKPAEASPAAPQAATVAAPATSGAPAGSASAAPVIMPVVEMNDPK
jgi:hypothetical protein